ncbi:MAG: PH domain-containing protein [Candidatus Saccharimonadales bacterium]
MVSKQSVEEQLKSIGFNHVAWGRSEVRELPKILMPDEEIYECVNGIYEGGFALLVATGIRLLLIDKKPLNYLTVEDLRFDMINEIDYSHRLLGARIRISAGSRNLKFTSYNQPRLRKLISHVQDCMANAKKQQSEHQEDQRTHLEQINHQLQTYLLAQHQSQQKLHEQLQAVQSGTGQKTYAIPEPADLVRPAPELSDYLFAQSLLAQHKAAGGAVPQVKSLVVNGGDGAAPASYAVKPDNIAPRPIAASPHLAELYAEGMQEIFGNYRQNATQQTQAATQIAPDPQPVAPAQSHNPLELTSLRIAYSKLPMALRNRRFGRPSFHAHSQTTLTPLPQAPTEAAVSTAL